MKLEYYDIYNALPVDCKVMYLEDERARHYTAELPEFKIGVSFEARKFVGVPRINFEPTVKNYSELTFISLQNDYVSWYHFANDVGRLNTKKFPHIKDEFFSEMARCGFGEFVLYLKATYPIYNS